MRHSILSTLIACTIVEAIQTVRPGAQWNVRGNTYDSIEWLDTTQAKPTKQELIDALTTCQTAQAARAAQKLQARQDVKNTALTPAQRIQALLILQDLDQ